MEYYIRNKQTSFLGNAPVWWCKNGQGYSAYLERAERFTEAAKDELLTCSPEKYEAWPCDLIDARLHKVFDWQSIGEVKQEMEKAE